MIDDAFKTMISHCLRSGKLLQNEHILIDGNGYISQILDKISNWKPVFQSWNTLKIGQKVNYKLEFFKNQPIGQSWFTIAHSAHLLRSQ